VPSGAREGDGALERETPQNIYQRFFCLKQTTINLFFSSKGISYKLLLKSAKKDAHAKSIHPTELPVI
jgi:hypothetical protein